MALRTDVGAPIEMTVMTMDANKAGTYFTEEGESFLREVGDATLPGGADAYTGYGDALVYGPGNLYRERTYSWELFAADRLLRILQFYFADGEVFHGHIDETKKYNEAEVRNYLEVSRLTHTVEELAGVRCRACAHLSADAVAYSKMSGTPISEIDPFDFSASHSTASYLR